MSKTQAIDILAFDAVAESENPIDVKMKGPDGNDTGIIFCVIGKNADAVTQWQTKQFNAMQREAYFAQKKRGKDPEPKTIEELAEMNIQGALVRVVGWKNVSQEFSKDILKKVLERNPHFVEQVIDASDDLGNFTKNA